MKTAIVIPARYGSSRLPGKPLLRETGKYLIQHVYEQACRSSADQVVVATDDERIFQAVQEFGGCVRMTSPDHPSGTDRVAEVARTLSTELLINLQGDEPLMDPQHLDYLIQLMQNNPAEMATLAVPLQSEKEWRDPHCVKVVCDNLGRALYFSRSPIPYVREGTPEFSSTPTPFLRHLGIYAYRREFLLKVTATPAQQLEDLEKLEQLRVLALGGRIQVGIVSHSASGVDTPEDYRLFVETYNRLHSRKAA